MPFPPLKTLFSIALAANLFPAQAQSIPEVKASSSSRVQSPNSPLLALVGNFNIYPGMDWSEAASFKAPGQLSPPEFKAHLGAIRLAGGKLWIDGFDIRLESKKWSYKQSKILDIECENIVVSLKEGPRALALDLPFSLEEGADKKIIVKSDSFVPMVKAEILQIFNHRYLEDHLKISASCPGNIDHFLKDLLITWLENYPKKNEKSWLAELDKKIPHEYALSIPEPFIAADRPTTDLGSWNLPREYRAHTEGARLLVEPKDVDTENMAYRYWHYGISEKADWSLALGEVPLQKLLATFLRKQSKIAHSVLREENKSFVIYFKGAIKKESFVTYIPELENIASPKVGLRVSFSNCRDEPDDLRVRPWISRLGTRAGLDWSSGLVMDFYDPQNPRISFAKRALPLWKLSFAEKTSGAWDYQGATFPPGTYPPDCPLKEMPPELKATLEYLMNSESTHDLLYKSFLASLGSFGKGALSLRVSGGSENVKKRPEGGFYGDLLIFDKQ